jgi:hypothetical protein
MSEIIKTIWGQTKLARATLAIGCLVFAGVSILQGIDVPPWFETLTTTAVLSYFVTRSDGTGAP